MPPLRLVRMRRSIMVMVVLSLPTRVLIHRVRMRVGM